MKKINSSVRMMENMSQLMENFIKEENNTTNDKVNVKSIKKAKNDKFYGIDGNNNTFYIKESLDGKKFNFIGGVTNKNKYVYESYNDAVSKLNLMLSSIEEGYFTEETKYKINVPLPKEEQPPMEEPTEEEPMAMDSEDKGDDKPFDEEGFDAGVNADEDADPKNYIEKLTGKLAQTLRQYEKEEGTDETLEKFVLNSLISATNTAEMDEEDQKDIIDKIKSAGAGESNGELESSEEMTGNEEDVEVSDEETEVTENEVLEMSDEPSEEMGDVEMAMDDIGMDTSEESVDRTEFIFKALEAMAKEGLITINDEEVEQSDDILDSESPIDEDSKEFPDLTGDGKVTKADILKGRGVIENDCEDSVNEIEETDGGTGEDFELEDRKMSSDSYVEDYEELMDLINSSNEHHDMEINNPDSYGQYDSEEYVIDDLDALLNEIKDELEEKEVNPWDFKHGK